MLLAAAPAWVVLLLTRQLSRLKVLILPLLAFLTTAALSNAFASPDKPTGFFLWLGIVELSLWLLITADLTSQPSIATRMRNLVVITSTLSALAGLTGLLLFYCGLPTRLIGSYGDLIPSTAYARIQAGFHNPNMLGSWCIFASAVAAWNPSGSTPNKYNRLIQGLLFITVALTFSRATFGFILAWVIREARPPHRMRKIAVAASLCLGAMFCLTWLNLAWDPGHPWVLYRQPTASSRWQELASSLDTLRHHPLLGCGLGTDPALYDGAPMRAHFTLLNIAATMGVPSLLAFLGILAAVWRRRDLERDLPLWSGLVGLAVDSLASDIEHFRHLWLLLGLLARGDNEGDVGQA